MVQLGERKKEERVRLYRSLQQGIGSLNIKRLLLIKENQIFQIKEFSVFVCVCVCVCIYGKIQESGPTEIIHFICISAI